MTRWMWRLFMHLDSGVVHNKRSSEHPKFASLTSLSLRAFHDIVYVSVHPHIRESILQVLDADRRDEEGSRDHVAESVDVSYVAFTCVAYSFHDVLCASIGVLYM